MFVEVGPFVVKIGYDKQLDTYYGYVYDGSIASRSSKPFLKVGTTQREIVTTEDLRNQLRDDVLHYGLELSPMALRDLEQRRSRTMLRETNIANRAEAY